LAISIARAAVVDASAANRTGIDVTLPHS